jgi:hypothetical protein
MKLEYQSMDEWRLTSYGRKRRLPNTYNAKEIARVSFTSSSDLRMFLVLSISTLNSMSDLFDFLISARRLSNSSAISILFAPGCGTIASPTALTPLYFQLLFE